MKVMLLGHFEIGNSSKKRNQQQRFEGWIDIDMDEFVLLLF